MIRDFKVKTQHQVAQISVDFSEASFIATKTGKQTQFHIYRHFRLQTPSGFSFSAVTTVRTLAQLNILIYAFLFFEYSCGFETHAFKPGVN